MPVRSPDGRDRRRRPREDLRQGRQGARRDPVFRPGGRGLRAPRPERSRQVDDRSDSRDADDGRRRERDGGGPRRRPRGGSRAARDRLRPAGIGRRPRGDGAREPDPPGSPAGHARLRPRAALRRPARDVRPLGQGERAREDVLGWDEAPARRRDGPRPSPPRPLPRRADDRARPRGARRDVGGARGARRRRAPDDPAHDALPRGGRPARPPGRDRLEGQGRRRRNARVPEERASRRRGHRRARRSGHRPCGRHRPRARRRARGDEGRPPDPPSGRSGRAGRARDPRRARQRGLRRQSVTVSRPSLDDVYLHHTGRDFRADDGESR